MDRPLDKQKFEELFNSSYSKVRNFIYYKIFDVDIASDIAQETFIKFWIGRNKVKSGSELSYLFGIASNLILNHNKHLKVVRQYEDKPHKSSCNETPQFIMEENEFNKQLEKAILSLSDNQREVFLMNRIDKLTYNEIADNLGVSVKAIEKRMHIALKKLHSILKRKL